jgi:hypothetical protein
MKKENVLMQTNNTRSARNLKIKHKITVDDGSQAFDNFINVRLEMAKDRDSSISVENLFANLRLKDDDVVRRLNFLTYRTNV